MPVNLKTRWGKYENIAEENGEEYTHILPLQEFPVDASIEEQIEVYERVVKENPVQIYDHNVHDGGENQLRAMSFGHKMTIHCPCHPVVNKHDSRIYIHNHVN